MNKKWMVGLVLAGLLAMPAAQAVQASPGTMTVALNGQAVPLRGYEIEGRNYFKLRDLAYVLRGTDSCFAVGFADGVVTLTTGAAYVPAGGELADPGLAADAGQSADVVQIDGQPVSLTAYRIGGYNYFQLRELGAAVGLDVDYDAAARTVLLTTAPDESDAQAILRLVNEAREEAGVSPLTLDETLCEAASIRAHELETLFSHTRPDGSTCFSVLDEVDVGRYYAAGENIAMGQRTPDAVMSDWMSSPGHRENILRADFDTLGAARYENGWVQLFLGS